MMRYGERPDPTDFDADQGVEDFRQKIIAKFEAKLDTFQTDADRITFPSKIGSKSTDLWKRYKAAYAEAQEGRCGFCELPVIGAQDGDVEHFRPKGDVHILDPDKQGREAQSLSNVSGRKDRRRLGTGYWWDAYSWDNYLLACSVCNQKWKKSFFPIEGDWEQRKRPARNVAETELLFNPFGNEDPASHFAYEDDGIIKGLTPMGIATIETAGLWRQSLVNRRRPYLEELLDLFAGIKRAENAELVRQNTRLIHRKGTRKFAPFPGMTRIYFTQHFNMSWAELEQAISAN